MESSRFAVVRARPPIHGCPKLMFNGPCAGGSGNVCEVTGGKCPWVQRFLEEPKYYAYHTVVLDKGFRITDYKPHVRKPSTRLVEKLAGGGPVLSYEYVAGSKPSPERVEQDLAELRGAYDAVNFVDTPLGLPHADPLALAIIASRIGVEPVVQVSCKDKSRLQLEALIIAMGLHGLGNMLAVTGDWPGLAGSENPRPVFDLDAVRLVYTARLMVDLGRTPAGTRVRVSRIIHVGVAVNPYFQPPRLEALKLAKKQRAGAEFAETQPIFDPSILQGFMEEAAEAGVSLPLMASILVTGSPGTLRAVEEFARIPVPRDYMEAVEKRGLRGAYEYASTIAPRLLEIPRVAGIHVLTMGDVHAALEAADRIKEAF